MLLNLVEMKITHPQGFGLAPSFIFQHVRRIFNYRIFQMSGRPASLIRLMAISPIQHLLISPIQHLLIFLLAFLPCRMAVKQNDEQKRQRVEKMRQIGRYI
jgi:hypothetical protein